VVWLERAFRRARSTAQAGLEHGHRVVSTVGVSPRRKSDKWRHRWTPHHRTHLRTAYTDTAPCGTTAGLRHHRRPFASRDSLSCMTARWARATNRVAPGKASVNPAHYGQCRSGRRPRAYLLHVNHPDQRRVGLLGPSGGEPRGGPKSGQCTSDSSTSRLRGDRDHSQRRPVRGRGRSDPLL